MFGNPETTTGGRALKFYSSVRIDIRTDQLHQGRRGRHRQPHQGQGRQEQGRPAVHARPSSTSYGEGISKIGELIDLGIEHKIVDKTGAWFSYGDLRIGEGSENAKEFLRDNPDVAAEIEVKIREKLGIGPVEPPSPWSRDRKPRKRRRSNPPRRTSFPRGAGLRARPDSFGKGSILPLFDRREKGPEGPPVHFTVPPESRAEGCPTAALAGGPGLRAAPRTPTLNLRSRVVPSVSSRKSG